MGYSSSFDFLFSWTLRISFATYFYSSSFYLNIFPIRTITFVIISYDIPLLTKETPFNMVYDLKMMMSIEVDTLTWWREQFVEECITLIHFFYLLSSLHILSILCFVSNVHENYNLNMFIYFFVYKLSECGIPQLQHGFVGRGMWNDMHPRIYNKIEIFQEVQPMSCTKRNERTWLNTQVGGGAY